MLTPLVAQLAGVGFGASAAGGKLVTMSHQAAAPWLLKLLKQPSRFSQGI